MLIKFQFFNLLSDAVVFKMATELESLFGLDADDIEGSPVTSLNEAEHLFGLADDDADAIDTIAEGSSGDGLSLEAMFGLEDDVSQLPEITPCTQQTLSRH